MQAQLSLTERVMNSRETIQSVIDSLPEQVAPRSFSGYGQQKETSNFAMLAGWEYDWSDKGNDSPPWSDWGDKEG